MTGDIASVLGETEKIRVYDLNYLDCSKGQYVSYLKWRGYHVEALYYNALEKTSTLYDEFFVKKKERWQFDEEGFQESDWPLIGVVQNTRYAESFREVEDEIIRRLQNCTIVFLSVDTYYLHTRPHVYGKHHEPHSLALIGRKDGDWLVLDERSSHLLVYAYTHEAICRAFDSPYGLKQVTCFEPSPTQGPPQVSTEGIISRYKTWLAGFEDDLSLYELIIQWMEESKDGALQEGLLRSISAAFTLLNGSRDKFAAFTAYMGFDPAIPRMLADCARTADSLRNSVNRAILSGKLPASSIIDKCSLLREQEREMIDTLKERGTR
ncbi:hypothetical protein DNH61_06420 [Paenibacillus sambharensis]|uniref:Butirosin biosynthesis protein H N-terminal domain-containing protein n=1 Tax=Paenibacillus sambharensis TaxID=1803190 RepID=A0A2W1L9E9_9BACL|nr:hypothetical protein [Paenibacillus sambharensis]PZD96828.1 hypothetical protein DNH61_06420 [Paenibacillus sambharensis]